MIFLSAEDLVHIADTVLPTGVVVRDHGLLEAAAARPRASVLGKDAYPTLEAKAAALLHSVARNHALVDGNERLALGAALAFLGMNGRRLTLSQDAAYDLVVAVATGTPDDVDMIAAVLTDATAARR